MQRVDEASNPDRPQQHLSAILFAALLLGLIAGPTFVGSSMASIDCQDGRVEVARRCDNEVQDAALGGVAGHVVLVGVVAAAVIYRRARRLGPLPAVAWLVLVVAAFSVSALSCSASSDAVSDQYSLQPADR